MNTFDPLQCPLIFAGKLWNRRIAEKKFLFVGMSGSGKTLNLKLLFKSALGGMPKGSNRRMLIYDPKGDWHEFITRYTDGRPQYAHPVYSFHPFYEDGYGYDFADDFSKSDNPFGMAVNFGKTLIPSNAFGSGENASFFTKAAQQVVAWVTYELSRKSSRWTIWDVIVAATDPRLVDLVLDENDRARAIRDSFKMTEVTWNNVLQSVQSYVWEIEPAALAWHHHIMNGRKLTFTAWFRREGFLLLCGHYKYPKSVEPMNALLLEFFRQHLRSCPETPWHEYGIPETWLFLDEFQQIAPMPELVDFFTLTRSKGATQVVGIQGIEELIAKYTDPMAHTILGQIGNLAMYRLESTQTLKYLTERIGEYEELRKKQSQNTSESTTYTQRETTTQRGTNQGWSEELIRRPGLLTQQLSRLSNVEGKELWTEGYYRVDGAYQRVRYAARSLPVHFPRLSKEPAVGARLLHADIVAPRAWIVEDFKRAGYKESQIPKGYHREKRPAKTMRQRLDEIIRDTTIPRDGSNGDDLRP